jgi:chromosome segregation and condensation protein ScpB
MTKPSGEKYETMTAMTMKTADQRIVGTGGNESRDATRTLAIVAILIREIQMPTLSGE